MGPARTGSPMLRRLRFHCGLHTVRPALSRLMEEVAALAPPDEAVATIELILAEVLNNIAEHAYGPCGGPVAVGLALREGRLRMWVADLGAPMPGNVPPAGRAPPLDGPLEHLPEGGFGWFLIRDHCIDLTHRRRCNVNRLDLWLPLHEGARPASADGAAAFGGARLHRPA